MVYTLQVELSGGSVCRSVRGVAVEGFSGRTDYPGGPLRYEPQNNDRSQRMQQCKSQDSGVDRDSGMMER